MEHSPLEENGRSAAQEMSRILGNQNFPSPRSQQTARGPYLQADEFTPHHCAL
jgi:hypothetical protein